MNKGKMLNGIGGSGWVKAKYFSSMIDFPLNNSN